MATALIGLAGALLGAMTALLAGVLSDRRQARSADRRWRRDQMANAYEQTLRHLVRAANRRSEVDALGRSFLKKEHHREWFDDFAEAQCWILILTSRCEGDRVDALSAVSRRLDNEFGANAHDLGYVHLATHGSTGDMRGTAQTLREAADVVLECARLDMSTAAIRQLPHNTGGRR